VAARFAEFHAAMPPGVEAAAERFVAALAPGAPVLDLGCGHGRDAAWLRGHGLSVTGADLSPGMLAQARARAPAVPLVEADMRRLPFAGGAFAGVWCNAALLHLPKPEAPAALAEMARVLRPGGRLYVALHEGDEETWEPTTWVAGEARLFARYRAEEIERIVEQAGFELLERTVEPGRPRTWIRLMASILPRRG
jgi:ubiquinone/menaquinone biosynthesis C-methylase UbiE